jgi:magnesium chelatase subunit H
MQKRTIPPDPTPIRVVIVSLDHHVAGAVERARGQLRQELPGLDLRFHAATTFGEAASLSACTRDIGDADIVFANMLFLEDHVRAILPAIKARKEQCDAMVCAMSSGEVMRETRMGRFRMDTEAKGVVGLLKKLRGSRNQSGRDGGQGQLAMLRRLPKLLAFIPGKAQDVRAYLSVLSYWLSGSSENLADLVRLLVSRYADGPRAGLRAHALPSPVREYPEVGLYHPALPHRVTESRADLPSPSPSRGTVGLLVMRSYILSHDSAHYDAVIHALERRGLTVVPAFAAGLDARPAIERYFLSKGAPAIDCLLSLTGFSLVGGPAFNDAQAAESILAKLDVPYVAAHALEFQSIERWRSADAGLSPVEATIMVAIPELEGAIAPTVFGGRPDGRGDRGQMVGIDERVEQLANRVGKLVRLRRTPRAEQNVAVVLYDFPPNGGAAGTAAHLSVFASLHRTLIAMAKAGYSVEVPATVDDLRARVLEGNAARFGTDANVLARVPVDEHVRRERHLDEIERAWGPAPGRQLADAGGILVQGARFGRVVVGVSPGFGYEGDPMRLLFAKGHAPTHAFSAFYRHLREDVNAHVLLHFGMHGALEFMPGKHVGLSEACWPERLLGDVPNVYLYASNNPSEGTLAKRRSAATLVSHLTPAMARSGLYKQLRAVRDALDQVRSTAPSHPDRARLLPMLQAEAAAADLASTTPPWSAPGDAELDALAARLAEVERTLIPTGLHVLGEPMSLAARRELLVAMCEEGPLAKETASVPGLVDQLLAGTPPSVAIARAGLADDDALAAQVDKLAGVAASTATNGEIEALLHALGGGFVRPAPGGDLLRNPDVLPTGRNVHGFDPFALPNALAIREGAAQADRLLALHVASGKPLPKSVAIVLWGSDNLKSGGGPIGQALALLGARPRFDSYGRLAGAELIPLGVLGRARVDALVTVSGIFRDLLPLQMKLLAEAALLAASAEDEPLASNPVRAHALAYMQRHGCDLETAALRVFSNAEGAYGSNVNQLVESGLWQEEDELAEAYERRKSFAYGRAGVAIPARAMLESVLGDVELAFQNLESIELGVTTIDHYFDTLGGIGRAVARQRADGAPVPIYIGDETRAEGTVRTLAEQVALESRTRSLNPKWAEAMLAHGAEGVRQIEAQVTNTLGWSATASAVPTWVYRELAQTYVLDREMRARLARLNPKASLKLAHRLLEATERRYWQPEPGTLAALREAGEELENLMEGVDVAVA